MLDEVRDLLAGFGADPDQAIQATNAASNQVWLTPRVVVSLGGADGVLLREAELVRLLPAEVGYPAVLGSGVVAGHEWMVTERLPGTNLAEAWPDMRSDLRRSAIEDLWARLCAVQHTDPEQARALGCTWTPFYALDPTAASDLLESLTRRHAIEPATSRRLAEILDRMFARLDEIPTRLVHTDAGPGNTVWTGTEAIPIDFEFACLGPADLDLENLFRSLAEDRDSSVAKHLAQKASAMLSLSGARDRLLGYAVLRDLWALQLWLRAAETPGRLESWGVDPHNIQAWQPSQYLHRHTTGSWLDRVL